MLKTIRTAKKIFVDHTNQDNSAILKVTFFKFCVEQRIQCHRPYSFHGCGKGRLSEQIMPDTPAMRRKTSYKPCTNFFHQRGQKLLSLETLERSF